MWICKECKGQEVLQRFVGWRGMNDEADDNTKMSEHVIWDRTYYCYVCDEHVSVEQTGVEDEG